jgi:hypothetical protein
VQACLTALHHLWNWNLEAFKLHEVWQSYAILSLPSLHSDIPERRAMLRIFCQPGTLGGSVIFLSHCHQSQSLKRDRGPLAPSTSIRISLTFHPTAQAECGLEGTVGQEFSLILFKNHVEWMELENIILSEVSLAQKTKNRMFSLICGH